MDPLSEIMSLLNARSCSAGGLDAAKKWSVSFRAYEGIKCYAVASGSCWLSVEGLQEPMHLLTGDCFLLMGGKPFSLSSDPALTPTDFMSLVSCMTEKSMPRINGGGDCCVVGGHFVLSSARAAALLTGLPLVVHLPSESDKTELRWALERMRKELDEARPGSFLVVQHLAHMMLIQALRLHATERLEGGVGWLSALADKHMNVAITAIHNDPAFPWTLEGLAKRVGMSRSGFALKFKETVGESPMEYVTRWRMMLAGDRLEKSSEPVSVIAAAVGYESESAFGKAFKRVMGGSPRQYRRPPRTVENLKHVEHGLTIAKAAAEPLEGMP